ncbi:MAG TPA: epimerase [Holophagaceae bacterium]|nr:epimerase [Holophagaceae bacterium]
MVGQGALRECLLDEEVEAILAVGRTRTGQQDPKLRQVVHADLYDFTAVEGDLTGYDACFFCLGATSSGLTEAQYRHITVDIAMSAGRTLAKLNPAMTFVFISGAGADSTGTSRTMWARVKGEAENAILALPFKAAYAFRPAFIQPMHGIQSKTRSYRILYALARPLMPLVKWLFPGSVTTTERLGRAMIKAVQHGAPKRILESADINAL